MLVDQVDRPRLLILVDVIRAAVLTVLVLTGDVSVAIIIAASVVLGTGETIAVTAAQSMLPMVVDRRPAQLQRANSRLQASRTVGREFVGSSLGGIMFAVASWIPFLANAVSFAASSAIIGLWGDYRPAGDERSRRSGGRGGDRRRAAKASRCGGGDRLAPSPTRVRRATPRSWRRGPADS